MPNVHMMLRFLSCCSCVALFRGGELDVVSSDRYLRLGSLSVSDWQRFFNTEYIEVIFRGVMADEVRTLCLGASTHLFPMA